MVSHSLARQIRFWIIDMFSVKTVVWSGPEEHIVSFNAMTTTTRASSMVTRLKLLVNEIARGERLEVVKELRSDPPSSRGDLALWWVCVHIPKNRRTTQNVRRSVHRPAHSKGA